MCEKCVVIDSKISKYRRMMIVITDQLARDAVAGLIDQMTKEKAGLHPERNQAALVGGHFD
jgi:hypothetical protein